MANAAPTKKTFRVDAFLPKWDRPKKVQQTADEMFAIASSIVQRVRDRAKKKGKAKGKGKRGE